MRIHSAMLSALLATVGVTCLGSSVLAALPGEMPAASRCYEWVPVTGTGVHDFTSAIVHSAEQTATGVVQRSTETVELSGDLEGRVLYHPESVYDFVAGTLVNTGHQVFSGTVLGSEPVLLHDDEFRFEVDLNTGATTGTVILADRIAGPKIQCNLDVFGTGLTQDGASGLGYSGQCKIKQGRSADRRACAGSSGADAPALDRNAPIPGS